ncbi:MAG: hypothetical protein ACK5SI_07155 [Planctomycetia bacterium]
MFVLRWTEEAAAEYARLKAKATAALGMRRHKARAKSSRDEGLFKQVHKCVSLLAENPRHPGLHTHEYHSLAHPFHPQEKVFEAYGQNRTPGAYRVFWCYGPKPGEITVIAVTPHP